MSTPLEDMANSINGVYVDYDGAPPEQPYQCHDVWLALLILLGLPVRLGWAPGYYGHTYEVWNQFPVVSGLEDHFTKHWDHNIQAGDAVFWPVSAQFPGTHVVLALGPVDPVDGTFLCVTQNPGPATITRFSAEGAAGYLRPKDQSINQEPIAPPARDRRKPVEYITHDTNTLKDKQRIGTRPVYLLLGGPDGSSFTGYSYRPGDFQLTAEVHLEGEPGDSVRLTAYRYTWDNESKTYPSQVYINSELVTLNDNGVAQVSIPISNRVPDNGSRLGLKAAGNASPITVRRHAVKGHRWEV